MSEITLAKFSVCEDRKSIIELGTSCEHVMTNKNSDKLHKGCNITWNRCYRLAAQFLGLLCVVLLAAIIMLYVEYKRIQTNYNHVSDERTEYNLSNPLATARDQHQVRFKNLSLENEQLENNYRIIQVSYSNCVEERDLLQNITVNITEGKSQLQSLISNLVKDKDKLRILSNNLTREKDQSEYRYKAMAEQRDQIQNWCNNITDEKNWLQTVNSHLYEERNTLTKERDKLQLEKGGLQKALSYFGWKYFKSSIYSISTVKMNWTVGRQHCIKSEADLVVINSKEEMIFVHGLISNLGAWLGLTDTENEGVWKWVDGKGLTTRYSCGPTVYDHAHLGHACSYVRFDILQRILSRIFAVNVIHAMVITDIDDKIIQRSLEENMSPTVLARMHEEEFKKDMEALRVLPPAVYMRVTENISLIVTFIERIIGNGHAYVTSQGNVYFDTKSIGNRYGKLVNLGGVVGEPGLQDKNEARDFALWKASKPHEPYWESPWGKGRPGWHIECSTIASSVFGSQLDIHSGGIDLAFPHHENEIAQSEAYHQCEQWGNYFLHSGHLHLKGSAEKMSKSLKNYITIKDFLVSYTANEFRLFCLLTKYRSGIEYSDASMNEARSTLSTISAFSHCAQAYMKGYLQCQSVEEGSLWERLSTTQASVRRALADDFDTPKALDAVMSLIHHGNCQLQPVTKADGPRSPAVFGAMLSYVREIMDVFGVDLLNRTEVHDSSGILNNLVEELVHFRSEVRKFALSVEDQALHSAHSDTATQRRLCRPDRVPLLKACDVLRNNLAPLGVNIKDRGTNSTWEITRTCGGDSKV